MSPYCPRPSTTVSDTETLNMWSRDWTTTQSQSQVSNITSECCDESFSWLKLKTYIASSVTLVLTAEERSPSSVSLLSRLTLYCTPGLT
jgi:hypothetical protein